MLEQSKHNIRKPENEMKTCSILLFGDLSASFEEDLKTLLHIHDSPLLTSFFEQSGARLRDEIGRLSTQKQSLFPHFTTLIDLVSKLGETDGIPILRFCLLSICQIGQFINYYGRNGRLYPLPHETFPLGICAGAFAAAAVSASRSLSELVGVASEIIIFAFRTALLSFNTKIDIVGNDEEHGGSWSVIVLGDETKMQSKVEEWSTRECIHDALRPYTSATTPTHITLSGPPSVLQRFIQDQQLNSHELPIQTPYHAPHIMDSSSIDKIIEDNLCTNSLHLTYISPSSGTPAIGDDYKSIIKTVIEDSLINQVRWDSILEETTKSLIQSGFESCKILPFSSNATQLLSTAMSRADLAIEVGKVLEVPAASGSAQHGHFSDSKIAIIGYSGRFPDSASNEAFWDLLRAGKDAHREVPPDRFNWRTHYDATGKAKNTSRVKYGCWIEEPGLFDARFFNISPREAENMDPAQRLALTAVYEAMEMAGIVPNRTPSTQQDRIGCFFGATSDDWREVNSSQNIDTYFIPGSNRAFIPGRISYFFRFSGPSLSMDTACSSSFAAIQTACAYLWKGECDTAVAGGTNVLTNPDNFTGLDRGHFLSTTGNCNAFDDGASGYCRADGVGSVILKRLEDAEMDNDPIFGIISGATTNHCGQTDSITRPHEGDQTAVFKRIIRHAGVNPLDVSYVEMHGTGTQAGDATEMNSVLSVFVPERQRMPRYPLYLGSAKASIGHGESASGVSSLIKVLMMMKHSEIPPHCGIKTKINHNYPLDLKDRNVNIAFKPTPWLRDQTPCGKRFAFLNNFSAAGGNTAVLLEDAPLPRDVQTDPRSFHLVAVSSKTPKSLRGNIEALIARLEAPNPVSVSGLAYTTTARRLQHAYRVAAVGADAASIAQSLRSKLEGLEPKAIPPAAKVPKVALMFTGQGSFYAGLGRELFLHVSSFRDDMKRFESIALRQGFPKFLQVIQGPETTGSHDPVVSQLATTCLQMALTRLWRTWGVKPSLVIGHSLGEYAALFAAEVLSASDTIFLVGTRAKLFTQHCRPGTHSMLAVKASAEEVKPLIEGLKAEVACLNQPTAVVVSVEAEEISRLTGVFKAKGFSTTQLEVPFAFHSSQVDPILEEFEAVAKSITYRAPSIPYLSPLLSQVISEEGTLGGEYLTKACRHAVNFQGALKAAFDSGLVDSNTIWLEIGPHPTCSGMVKGTLGSDSKTVSTLRKDTDTWKVVAISLEILYLNGIQINWNEFHRDFEQFNRVIEMPRYSWDLKNYWILYRNDFCLAKGEGTQPATSATVAPKSFKYLSPSLQKVLEEEHGDASSSMLVESDVHDPNLVPIFTGHQVHGAKLCPASLWADVVMHLTNYMMEKRSLSTKDVGIDVGKMQIGKSLVLNPDLSSQLFRVSAAATWSDSSIKFSIYSVNDQGGKTITHATCTVKFTPGKLWADEWKRNAYLIRSRIKALRQSVEHGEAHRMKQAIVYRLFANIVEYSKDYRNMNEIVLDSKELEAFATSQFQVDDRGFYFNPQWMDSVGGVAGFIMNGNDSPHPKAEVFINHGWEGFKYISRLEQGKTYHSYNRMQLVEGTLYAGDTYIFDGDEIVAIIQQIQFLGIPRRALDVLRPSTKSRPAAAPMRRAPEIPLPKTVEKKLGPSPRSSPAAPAYSGGIWAGILGIVADEVGVDLGDLKPDTEFAELGLDSLLSLTITSRIREDFNLDLPSTIFADSPTVKELQQLYGADHEASLTVTDSSDEEKSGTSTPDTSLTSEPEMLDHVHIIRSTIAEETGIKIGELTASTRLDEIGVDSLLALTAMGRLSEMFEVDLPSSLFAENETLSEIEKAIAAALGLNTNPATSMPDPASEPLPSSFSSDPVVRDAPHATSVLLQASSTSATSTIFMLPDGSGSASSYSTLARIDPKVAVYGLNCPWRTTPEDMTRSGCTIEQLSAKFVTEVRRRQPKGPYILGGWSAGGICAFEAARQLAAAGEVIENLIMIDTPNPIGVQSPPAHMFEFFQQLGLFGTGGNVPKWLRLHFNAFVGMLDDYDPVPWPKKSGPAPKTLVLYATDGVCHGSDVPKPEIRPDDPREMVWMLNDRTDFSAHGWASLMDIGRITVKVLEGVNHFSVMESGPQMEKMGGYIKAELL
ncbi:Type I Iterative Polyketide synthase (PKS) [Fusarium albosuccineum]|uniref:Type I Iterative Polyketide synthase (PKS) n=1 Tax=Fusarium albosuccineum TaxID=1237068 RepID=A0A8H4KUF0_9HYPO|nr:Type I Iterative Polyketide synthase (PKS) [Fusarium albosuccineum]